MPTKEESRKPGRVRSIRYQMQGFARARVSESWRVDCHGRRRCRKGVSVMLVLA